MQQTQLFFTASRGRHIANQICFGHNFDFIADADTEKYYFSELFHGVHFDVLQLFPTPLIPGAKRLWEPFARLFRDFGPQGPKLLCKGPRKLRSSSCFSDVSFFFGGGGHFPDTLARALSAPFLAIFQSFSRSAVRDSEI